MEATQSSIAFRCLSKLGVNQHIDVPLRTMSNMFEGLGMIELNGIGLRDRIHHIRRFWGTATEEYNWLKHAHETFLMDEGLGGNVVTRNYGALGFLAEHS